jgi:hypothetical protein
MYVHKYQILLVFLLIYFNISIVCAEKFPPDALESVYTLEKKSNYYTFHKDTSDDIQKNFSLPLINLKKKGSFRKYFANTKNKKETRLTCEKQSP